MLAHVAGHADAKPASKKRECSEVSDAECPSGAGCSSNGREGGEVGTGKGDSVRRPGVDRLPGRQLKEEACFQTSVPPRLCRLLCGNCLPAAPLSRNQGSPSDDAAGTVASAAQASAGGTGSGQSART